MTLIFDIETEPLAREELARVCEPFDPSTVPHPGQFDPDSVKLGNLKDEAKIAKKIEDARAEHEKAVANHAADVAAAEAKHWADITDRAALDATTGRICAIGYRNDAGQELIQTALTETEEEMIRNFWTKFAECRDKHRQIIGFNSNRFDVPFIARRSWILGVPVPKSLTTPTGYLCQVFVDLMEKWQVGDRSARVSLNKASLALGIGGKPDDCTGADFHRLLRGSTDERIVAIEYLKGDLEMTYRLAERLGVV